jgi:hypothetical protein
MGQQERIIRLCKLRKDGMDGSWSAALALSRRTHCQDKHDRIHGLLGLVKSELKVYPDYLRSICDVFFEVLRLEMQDNFNHWEGLISPAHDIYEHTKYDEFFAICLYGDLYLDKIVNTWRITSIPAHNKIQFLPAVSSRGNEARTILTSLVEVETLATI